MPHASSGHRPADDEPQRSRGRPHERERDAENHVVDIETGPERTTVVRRARLHTSNNPSASMTSPGSVMV